jgi:Asp-tRNA(Asn)/Glu-tRNA(Gln) amidotransferase A subunit family amidase
VIHTRLAHYVRESAMGVDLHLLTVAEAARLIAARKLSPVELTQAMLHRIETFDGQINAFITGCVRSTTTTT